MPIARTLKTVLEENHIKFDTVEHAHTESAIDSAKSAHIPPHQMAKAVVLEDENGFIVSVLPRTTASTWAGSTRNWRGT